jgi:WYL domain
MAPNLFNRYIWLVDTIHRSGKITFDELNTKWLRNSMSDDKEIPLRTFHNHRAAIEELFDINIVCDKSTYKYYIDNNEDIEKGGVRSWLLNTFAVNNLINESHKLKHRILFEDIPSGQQYLTTIIEAMRDSVKLEISYQSYWKVESAIYEIEPYFVKVFKQRWYVIAKSDKLRIYALDRIKSLTASRNSYKMPDDFDAEVYFYNCYGIIQDESIKAETVILKISSDQAKYLRALPLHSSQKETEKTPDYSVFEYFIKPTFDLRQEILSLGESVEVLAPERFRKEIKELIENMIQAYK